MSEFDFHGLPPVALPVLATLVTIPRMKGARSVVVAQPPDLSGLTWRAAKRYKWLNVRWESLRLYLLLLYVQCPGLPCLRSSALS